jgi:hypothetical protein
MSQSATGAWTPFRPSPADLARIEADVAAIPDIQAELVDNAPGLKLRDRVAHQYQIAGGKVALKIAAQLPDNLDGVGLFQPNAEHTGVARISTGLGCPHLETDPDFLGIRLAFLAPAGARVDFLGINDPTSPTDDHLRFMALLAATADAAGTKAVIGSGLGRLRLADLLAINLRLVKSLMRRIGWLGGLATALHVTKQTARTARSTTAYQTYWTGIVETGGVPGKFVIEPMRDENRLRPPEPGERYLSREWRERQARAPVEFNVHWIPFISEAETSTIRLTQPWREQRHLVGRITFPRLDAGSEEARLWSALAAEMGANAGNWVRDRANSIPLPGTVFGVARLFAYRKSQDGRGALPEASYAGVFQTGVIDGDLAAELALRRADKRRAGHVDSAP